MGREAADEETRAEERDPEQAWFWTERWQQMEREADADYAAGRVKRFDDVESLLAHLDADLDSEREG